MKTKVLLIILLQLLVISFLIFYITERQKKSSRTLSFSPIKKENIVFNPSANLKFFYEPKENSMEEQSKDWLKEKITYTINSDSLNDRFNYSIDKRPDTYRIIALGDSFTFGQFVNTFENYPERLEDLLNNNMRCKSIKRFEVINLGVYGYDLAYAVERFRIRGVKYNPDLVLWIIGSSNLMQINEYMKPRNGAIEALNKNSKRASQNDKNKYYAAWETARNEMISNLGKEAIRKYQLGAFNRFKKLYDGQVITFGFLDDESQRFMQKLVESRPKTIYYKNIPYIYSTQGAAYPDFHPSSLGDKMIAEDIFGYLKENIISCN